MVDNKEYNIFGILGIVALILAFILVPINNSQSTHATDVSNDQPVAFLNIFPSNSTSAGFNTGTINCSYLVYTNVTSGAAPYIFAKNCSTSKIDFSGKDASIVINSAIQALTKGGQVYIAQGNYIINHPMNLSDSVQVRGMGPALNRGTWLELNSTANINMFQYLGGSSAFFMTLRDLYLDGHLNTNANTNATYLNANTNDFQWNDVYEDNFGHGLVIDKTHGHKTLEGYFEHNKGQAIIVKGGDDLRILDTKFRGSLNGQFGCITSFDSKCLSGISSVIFQHNKVEAGNITLTNFNGVIGQNVFASNIPTNSPAIIINNNSSNTDITGNFFDGNNAGNFAIKITNSTTANVDIENNQFIRWTQASVISDSGTNTVIRNNIPTSVNNDLIAGSGISIIKGVQSNTISSSSSDWTKLCSTTLGSANSTISCDNFTAMRNLVIQVFSVSNGGTGISPAIRFNGDIGTNYAYRISTNGGADTTTVSQSLCGFDGTLPTTDTPYTTIYLDNNLSGSRKLAIMEQVMGADTSSATAPTRAEAVCKWSNTSAQITSITILANAGTGNFNTGSELTVWGYN